MTPALSKVLPAELRAAIDELSAVHVADDASFEELLHVCDERVELLTLLERALALAPELAAGLTVVAEGAPYAPRMDDPWGPIGTEQAILPHRDLALAIATSLDDTATVSTTGARINVRLTVDNVPMLWLVELGGATNFSNGLEPNVSFLRARHTLEANVPRELPRLAVRPEGIGDAVLKLLQLEHDVQLGDETFDRLCFVEGDPAFVEPLLAETVRQRLVLRVKRGNFRLVLDAGVATLTWTRMGMTLIGGEELKASAQVLADLRHAAISLTLVRESI